MSRGCRCGRGRGTAAPSRAPGRGGHGSSQSLGPSPCPLNPPGLTRHSPSFWARALGLLARSPWLHRECSAALDYRNLAVSLKNGGFLLAVVRLCDAVIVEKNCSVLSVAFTCGSLCPPKYLLLFISVRTVQNKGAGRE